MSKNVLQLCPKRSCKKQICLLIVWLGEKINSVPEGFNYSGISSIMVTIGLVTLFYTLPIERNEMINMLSKYTMGVYFSHMLVGAVLINVVNIYEYINNSFINCIVIFICSYILSFGISLLPFKACKEIVE